MRNFCTKIAFFVACSFGIFLICTRTLLLPYLVYFILFPPFSLLLSTVSLFFLALYLVIFHKKRGHCLSLADTRFILFSHESQKVYPSGDSPLLPSLFFICFCSRTAVRHASGNRRDSSIFCSALVYVHASSLSCSSKKHSVSFG